MIARTRKDIEDHRSQLDAMAGYKLTDNQILFCIDAMDAGFVPRSPADFDDDDDTDPERGKKDIDFTYSGRGMYGDKCPSVDVDDVMKVPTTANVKVDNSGLGYVVYAQY